MKKELNQKLWGEHISARWFWGTAIVLIFGFLGARFQWTMENRWANIVLNMMYRKDYLHPILLDTPYYDKPLMTYWLILLVTKLTNTFNDFILRLPSALAGLLTLISTYHFALRLQGRAYALKSCWILLTSLGFLFWSRVASADIYNVMGIVMALWCYEANKQSRSLKGYFLFFAIIAFTCQCKGLGALVCTGLAILPDIIKKKSLRLHLNFKLLLGLIFGVVLYLLPFYLSAHFNHHQNIQDGLKLVYQENILRFFHPWDHKGPVYTYFLFLPLYSFPWVFIGIFAVIGQLKSWKSTPWTQQWILIAFTLIFTFFTLSHSRRSYYILPLMPFVALIAANWITSVKREVFTARLTLFLVIMLGVYYLIALPIGYLGGDRAFCQSIKSIVTKDKSWDQWHFLFLNTNMRNIAYIHPSHKPLAQDLSREFDDRVITKENATKAWPALQNLTPDTIIVTSYEYAGVIQQVIPNYKRMNSPQTFAQKSFSQSNQDNVVVFIP